MFRTVNLDEKKHAVKMLRGLNQMWEQNNECDFVIKVGTKEFHAHKNVLSVGSPYFEAMFKHDTKEKREGKVEMKDVDYECVKSCIDFIYTGNFVIPDEKIIDLLHVAVMLQLDDVKTAIHQIMCQELNVDNFYEMRDIAELYGLQNLASQCQIFYQEKLLAIYTQPQFKCEDKSYLMKALKSKKISLSESKKLDVCLTWIKFNPDEKESLSEMLKHIKLEKVSSNVLRDLENNLLVKSDLNTCELINDALTESSKKSSSHIVLLGLAALPRPLSLLTHCRLQFYDPSTNEIGKFHDDINLPRDCRVISMDTHVYVFHDKIVGRFDYMDKTSKWERMENMLVDHGRKPPVVSLLGSLFVIGTASDSWEHQPTTNNVERFDSDTNKWFILKDMPRTISNPTLVSLDDSIYCIGGCPIHVDNSLFHGGYVDGHVPFERRTNAVCRFTPATSEWVDLEPMRVTRQYCVAVALEQKQKIYVIGRFCEDMIGSSECYDVTTAQWSFISPMTIVDRNYLIDAHYFDGYIFVVERDTLKTMKKYDIKADKWSKVDLDDIHPPDFFTSVIVPLSE